MASFNRVDLIGRLGADPESRKLNSGDPVVNFRMAVSDVWRDKSTGERREKTTWVPVVIFNENLCKTAENFLRKGSQCLISGSLQNREYEKDGQRHTVTEVVLQKFRGELQLLDAKPEGTRQDRTDDRGGYDTSKSPQRPLDHQDNFDDEIPF